MYQVHITWEGFELTTTVVISTDMIMTTTAPEIKISNYSLNVLINIKINQTLHNNMCAYFISSS